MVFRNRRRQDEVSRYVSPVRPPVFRLSRVRKRLRISDYGSVVLI